MFVLLENVGHLVNVVILTAHWSNVKIMPLCMVEVVFLFDRVLLKLCICGLSLFVCQNCTSQNFPYPPLMLMSKGNINRTVSVL